MANFVINPEKKQVGDSLTDYINYFARISTANGWSDAEAARIFPGLLEVGANDLDELDETTLSSFDSIKQALSPGKEFFREAEVRNFFSMQKLSNESVVEFFKRCKNVVNVCYKKFAKANKDLLTRDRFIHGLPNWLKVAVLNQKNSKADEAVEAALLAETVRDSFPEHQSGSNVPVQKDQIEKFQSKKLLQGSPKSVDFQANIVCFKCGTAGHIARFCPKKSEYAMPGQSSMEHRDDRVSGVEVNKIDRPKVDAVVNGVKLKLLIDTGSCISVLPNSNFVARSSTKSQFKTATDMPIKIDGILPCGVMINSWEFDHEFYVGNVSEPVLGMDFMKAHAVVIDTCTGQLMVNDHKVAQMYQTVVSDEQVLPISAIIPPECEETAKSVIRHFAVSERSFGRCIRRSPQRRNNRKMSRYREWPLDCKVYVGNLLNNTAKHEIEEAFGKYGPVKNVCVARNPPGFAFVEFDDPRDAEDAVRGMDGTRINGSRVRCEMSHGKSREIRPAEEKWKAIREFPRPTNAQEMKRFLGLVGYYRSSFKA